MSEIKICYNFMIENIPQFQEFVEQHKQYSDEEMMQKYNMNLDHDKNME